MTKLNRGESSIVISDQLAPHKGLSSLVQKYQCNRYRHPIAPHTAAVFESLSAFISEHPNTPIIIDSGCGTGISSIRIAENAPHHLVVGIDKSEKRLNGVSKRIMPSNCLVIRADLIDLWLLMAREAWPIEKHYLLYPNPWPKAKHLKRRWHGHPIFGVMIALSPLTELRTNWQIYAEEFALATRVLFRDLEASFSVEATQFTPQQPLTPFEKKYAESGHALFQVQVETNFT